MRIELPDTPGTEHLTAEEMRLELACALFAQGKVSIVTGAHLAGLDFFSFQQALGEREIPIVTETNLQEDLATIQRLSQS
jgi:predicted HTH domain antitoxin